jgi:hypothetical protein
MHQHRDGWQTRRVRELSLFFEYVSARWPVRETDITQIAVEMPRCAALRALFSQGAIFNNRDPLGLHRQLLPIDGTDEEIRE